MGLRAAFDRSDAERYLAHLQPGWRLAEDEQARLRVRRRLRTKNFVKARPEGRGGFWRALLTPTEPGDWYAHPRVDCCRLATPLTS
jgi:hypothetical protein